MLKVIGYKGSAGTCEFNGKSYDYDNILYYLVDDAPANNLVGSSVLTVKIKSENIKDNPPTIGDYVAVYYDRYGKPLELLVVNE